eukprot:7380491-Prymnesium_polylepis.1
MTDSVPGIFRSVIAAVSSRTILARARAALFDVGAGLPVRCWRIIAVLPSFLSRSGAAVMHTRGASRLGDSRSSGDVAAEAAARASERSRSRIACRASASPARGLGAPRAFFDELLRTHHLSLIHISEPTRRS